MSPPADGAYPRLFPVESSAVSITLVASYENPERDRCVDLFARDDGSFGFEEWRREPEDAGNWYRARYYASTIYATAAEALSEARAKVPWFGALPPAD